MCGLEYPEQMWQIATARTMAYRKTTELVHTQLVRKGRAHYFDTKIKDISKNDLPHLINPNYRGEIFNHPTYGKVYTTGRYNIKSPSKMPYDRNDYNNLGLNQYFVGQSPYQPYIGDPGDDNGIYHDKSEIIGPVRAIIGCDKYSGDELAKGTNLEFPFKMYEIIDVLVDNNIHNPVYQKIKTGYEVEVIAKLKSASRTIVTKSERDGGEHGSHEVVKERAEVFYSVYALKDGGLLFYGSDPDVVWRAANDPTKNGGVDTSNLGHERLTFYADGELKDQPTRLKKFVEQWDKFHGLEVKEDADGWLGIAEIVLSIIGIVCFIFAPVLAPMLGFASAGWGYALGVISVALSAASIGLMLFDPKAAKILGIAAGVAGLTGAVGNVIKNIFSNTATNVASSSASTLSAAGTAGKMGLSQTSSLYLGTGAMNASGVGASNLTSMSFSEVLKASNISFSEAINVSVSGIESSLEASLWSSTMDALKSSYKVYSNTKDVFKNANDFSDDEIPNNDDKEVKRPVALRFNGSLESMVGYAKEGADDIGLMEGSALYLRPSDKGFDNDFLANLGLNNGLENVVNDDFLASPWLNNWVNTGNSLESRVLKLVYIKQIKLYKKAKKGAYNTRISRKRSKNA